MNTDSARLWRRAFFALLVAFVVAGGWILYRLIDFGVTHTHMTEGCRDAEKDLKVLAALAPALGQKSSKADVLHLLRAQNPGELISEQGREVRIGQLRFLFGSSGELVEVRRS